MDTLEQLIQRVRATQHGFSDIRRAADGVIADSARDSLGIAQQLLTSEVHQARMLATFILGRLAAHLGESLNLLRFRVSQDRDWRVQEILAQAFEQYCADLGYEPALPVDWLSDSNPNVRRAVSEGLRIWTAKPYFRDHPQEAIRLLSSRREDESEYVRKSVGNALRDISRKHKTLVQSELQTWNLSDQRTLQIHKLASKFL